MSTQCRSNPTWFPHGQDHLRPEHVAYLSAGKTFQLPTTFQNLSVESENENGRGQTPASTGFTIPFPFCLDIYVYIVQSQVADENVNCSHINLLALVSLFGFGIGSRPST